MTGYVMKACSPPPKELGGDLHDCDEAPLAPEGTDMFTNLFLARFGGTDDGLVHEDVLATTQGAWG